MASRRPAGQKPVAPNSTAQGAVMLPPREDAAVQQQQQPAERNGVRNGSGSVGDEGSDGTRTIRCHCGMDHGDGDNVECMECRTVQHKACMGLTPWSFADGYMCELCRPRRLPVTRPEARRFQRTLLNCLQVARSTARRPVPMANQPVGSPSLSRALLHLNTYSKSAMDLLLSMPPTAGANKLIEDSRKRASVKRMNIATQVDALVTTKHVSIRQVVVELNGFVSMANETERQPGGANGLFMYDGLMIGTNGEEIGDEKHVCIDTTKSENESDSQVIRRSCKPNCVLKHVLGSQTTLGVMAVATQDIHPNIEVTLPFESDWRLSDVPLQCVEHADDMNMCNFEVQRRVDHTFRVGELERLEKKRHEEEERRRVIEEVRREREAKFREMNKEKERLEREQQQKNRAEETNKDEAAAGPSDQGNKNGAKDGKKAGILKGSRKEAENVDRGKRNVRFQIIGDSTSTDDRNHEESDGPSTSSSMKRGRDSETDASGVRKRARTDPSGDNEESVSNGASPDLTILFEHVPVDKTPEEASTSLRDLLVLLRNSLLSVNSDSLKVLLATINYKIERCRGDQKIPLKHLHLAFDPCIFLLKKHACPTSKYASTSLRRFMSSLQTATCHLIHPSMESFHEQLEDYLGILNNGDLKIPHHVIRNAIAAIINFVDS